MNINLVNFVDSRNLQQVIKNYEQQYQSMNIQRNQFQEFFIELNNKTFIISGFIVGIQLEDFNFQICDINSKGQINIQKNDLNQEEIILDLSGLLQDEIEILFCNIFVTKNSSYYYYLYPQNQKFYIKKSKKKQTFQQEKVYLTQNQNIVDIESSQTYETQTSNNLKHTVQQIMEFKNKLLNYEKQNSSIQLQLTNLAQETKLIVEQLQKIRQQNNEQEIQRIVDQRIKRIIKYRSTKIIFERKHFTRDSVQKIAQRFLCKLCQKETAQIISFPCQCMVLCKVCFNEQKNIGINHCLKCQEKIKQSCIVNYQLNLVLENLLQKNQINSSITDYKGE